MDPVQPEPTLFASAREKRLWIWALTIVVGIYATLGLASTLVEVLRNRGVFDVVFICAFLLVGVTILTQGLRVRPGGLEVGIGIGVAAVYLMVFARVGIPERSHLFEYGVLAAFVFEALSERAQHRKVPAPAVLACLLTSILGTLDECIQGVLPNRHFAWEDLLFNTLASVMSVVGLVVLGFGRRWREAKTGESQGSP